jgi:hypothetical protein
MNTRIGRIIITSFGVLVCCAAIVYVLESYKDPSDEEKAQAVWGSPEWTELSPGVYKFPAKRNKVAKINHVVESEDFQVIFQRFLASHRHLEVVSMAPMVGQWGNEVVTQYIMVVTRPKTAT